mgnify:CR=1 FL=1
MINLLYLQLHIVNSDELLYELECSNVVGEAYDDFVIIENGVDLTKTKAFKNGLFYIEDLSSYNCAKALNAKENDIVLDMCSAPGGKAFTISQSMNNSGVLICKNPALSLLTTAQKGLISLIFRHQLMMQQNIMIISQKRTKFFAMFLAPALV